MPAVSSLLISEESDNEVNASGLTMNSCPTFCSSVSESIYVCTGSGVGVGAGVAAAVSVSSGTADETVSALHPHSIAAIMTNDSIFLFPITFPLFYQYCNTASGILQYLSALDCSASN
jgi:hypothetical protein